MFKKTLLVIFAGFSRHRPSHDGDGESLYLDEKIFNTYSLLIYPWWVHNKGQNMGQVSAPKQNQKCTGADYGMFYDLGV